MVVDALITKPTPPSVAASAQNGPRILNLSESQQSVMMVKKQRTYGGAERPWDWILEKAPISEMMVGTNNGSDANETLLYKTLALNDSVAPNILPAKVAERGNPRLGVLHTLKHLLDPDTCLAANI